MLKCIKFHFKKQKTKKISHSTLNIFPHFALRLLSNMNTWIHVTCSKMIFHVLLWYERLFTRPLIPLIRQSLTCGYESAVSVHLYLKTFFLLHSQIHASTINYSLKRLYGTPKEEEIKKATLRIFICVTLK
jgi:hypothetical protein